MSIHFHVLQKKKPKLAEVVQHIVSYEAHDGSHTLHPNEVIPVLRDAVSNGYGRIVLQVLDIAEANYYFDCHKLPSLSQSPYPTMLRQEFGDGVMRRLGRLLTLEHTLDIDSMPLQPQPRTDDVNYRLH